MAGVTPNSVLAQNLDHLLALKGLGKEAAEAIGAVLYELLGSDIEVGRIEFSDICEPLIALWQVVKDDPNGLVEGSSASWTE